MAASGTRQGAAWLVTLIAPAAMPSVRSEPSLAADPRREMSITLPDKPSFARSRADLRASFRSLWHSYPMRLALQTAGGAALAFALAKALGIQEVSWIVLSAVFVVQSSIGGTIHSALWRMAGGGAGLLLGLIASLLFGGGEWSTSGRSLLVADTTTLLSLDPCESVARTQYVHLHGMHS